MMSLALRKQKILAPNFVVCSLQQREAFRLTKHAKLVRMLMYWVIDLQRNRANPAARFYVWNYFLFVMWLKQPKLMAYIQPFILRFF